METDVSLSDKLSCYVKLNVGGTLFYTTISTLMRGNTMLNAMFSGRMEVKTDDQGWVLIDRNGKHFGTILNYLRDGSVPLPETRRELEELLIEAKFFCIEGLKMACEEAVSRCLPDDDTQYRASIVIVKCPKAAKAILSSTRKPVVKLTMNRYNNVFSYTNNSHDNLLRNIECLEKYALMFGDSVLFAKDVRDKSEQNEICEWSYFYRAYKLKSIDCIAIHYSADKRLIKVEFPESRIHEEMLFLLSVASRGLTDAELMNIEMRKGSGTNGGQNTMTSLGSPTPPNTIQSNAEEPSELDRNSLTGGLGNITFQLTSSTPTATPSVSGVCALPGPASGVLPPGAVVAPQVGSSGSLSSTAMVAGGNNNAACNSMSGNRASTSLFGSSMRHHKR